MRLQYLILLLLLGLIYCGAKKDEDQSSCKLCRVDLDDFPGCWNQSLTHFTTSTRNSINDLASVFVHFSRWKHLRDLTDDYKTQILEQVLADYDSIAEEDRGPVTSDQFREIYTIIFNVTERIEPKYEDAIYLPSISCSTPCDYADRMYVALFFVLVIAFFLSVIVFLVYLCLIHRKTDNEGQLRSLNDRKCFNTCVGVM